VTTPRSRLRSYFLAPALGASLALLAAASFSGCLVSFDGYELADAGGATNDVGGSGQAARGGGEPIAGGGGGNVSGGTAGNNGGTANGGATSAGASGRGGTNGLSGASGMNAGGMNAGGMNAGGMNAGGMNAGGMNAGGARGGGGGSGGGGGGSAGAPTICPQSLHGTFLVAIPDPAGGIFCIDRQEVTNLDYQAFLDSNPTIPTSGVCSANPTFAPAVDALNCTQFDPAKPNVPVACVNWCDAQAYCAWAGKRLCGKIGGGANAPADFADATKSEWYRTCSHAGQYKFPYGAVNGDMYDGSACVDPDKGLTRPTAVPTSTCQGGYDGVFDMSGNVSEWEDSCAANSGLSDQCLYRGGSYRDLDIGTTPSLLCGSGTATVPKSAAAARSTRDNEIGFRCCADP